MYPFRARFKKQIIVEFFPPKRPSGKVMIFCPGMPSYPSNSTQMELYSRKGYWTFRPRYRGTWESAGKFLAKSPEQDILDIIDQLPEGFTDVMTGRLYRVKPSKLYVIGSSFGGAAAILASRDPRVTKAVGLSPVVDWRSPSRTEPLGPFYNVVKESFGEAYRMSEKDWGKLKTGKFYNPMHEAKSIDGSKLLLVHGKKDDVVDYKSVVKFGKLVGARTVIVPNGGHFAGHILTVPTFTKKLLKFLRT
jgi:pimeloyl-ACP methyl ester carboxylesterase